ncbi:MAG: HD domain-containing protein [Verrucomicrobiae bacterium]|nr:HD domain-containing protein [Verrucomicrobiae bacterium]
MPASLEGFRPNDAMRAEVAAFMGEREPEPEHVTQVCALALSLFDQLQERHRLDEGARFLLESGALLHDIGWSEAPDGRKHHKLAYQMIRSHAWESVPAEAVAVIALIARYHRRAMPDASHEGFADLALADRELVNGLAAILRVADALDRSHQARVNGIGVHDRGDTMEIRLRTPYPCGAELDAAESKKDLFEEAFRTSLSFVLEGR